MGRTKAPEINLADRRRRIMLALDNASLLCSEAARRVSELQLYIEDEGSRSVLRHQVKKLKMAKGICSNVQDHFRRPFDDEVSQPAQPAPEEGAKR